MMDPAIEERARLACRELARGRSRAEVAALFGCSKTHIGDLIARLPPAVRRAIELEVCQGLTRREILRDLIDNPRGRGLD